MLVVIDPGHGGSDPGGGLPLQEGDTGYFFVREDDFVKKMGTSMRHLLKRHRMETMSERIILCPYTEIPVSTLISIQVRRCLSTATAA